MSTHRMDLGHRHEQAVAQALTDRGWLVDPFGMGQLSPQVREHLIKANHTEYVRWFPDLIAVKPGIPGALAVDAKTGREDTKYHAIEQDALSVYNVLESALNLPVLIVWGDMSCNWPRDLRPVKYVYAAQTHNGSGTPYVLCDKAHTVPMDKALGRAMGSRAA